MTLLALIAEARGVREYLRCPECEDFDAHVMALRITRDRADRIIATLESLAASPYASGIETALRVEYAMADNLAAIEALQAARMGGGA